MGWISNEEIIKYYKDYLPGYERVWMNKDNLAMHYGYWTPEVKSHHESLLNMNCLVAEKGRIAKGDVVLDAGCGVGGTAIWLAKEIGCRAVGITICGDHVENCKKNAERKGVSHLTRFEERDFTKTGYPDGAFDVVFGIESVCYANDKRDFIREAYRILRPGGRAIVADGFMGREPLNDREAYAYRNFCESWALPDLAKIDEFRTELRDVGFADIGFMDITENVMPSSVRMHRINLILYPLRLIAQLLRPITGSTKKASGGAVYQRELLTSGIMKYCVFSAEKLLKSRRA